MSLLGYLYVISIDLESYYHLIDWQCVTDITICGMSTKHGYSRGAVCIKRNCQQENRDILNNIVNVL